MLCTDSILGNESNVSVNDSARRRSTDADRATMEMVITTTTTTTVTRDTIVVQAVVTRPFILDFQVFLGYSDRIWI